MNKRILLIDDDPDDADLFGTALKEWDYWSIFHYLSDSTIALDLLRHKKIPLPTVIFLDINMPRSNGLDLLREIKAVDFLKPVPVVMYSTSYLQRELEMAIGLGASECWTKPVRYPELVKNLNRLMTGLDSVGANTQGLFSEFIA